MLEGIEKRKSQRQDCHVPVVSGKKSPFGDSQTIDISKGGVGFISKRFIPVDTKMVIELDLTPDSEPVLTTGQVKWVSRLTNSGCYRVGLSFTDLSTGLRSRLGKYFS